MKNSSNAQKVKQFYLLNKELIHFFLLACLFFVSCFFKPFVWVAFSLMATMILFGGIEEGFSYLVFGAPFHFIHAVYSSVAYLVCAVLFVVKFLIVLFVKEKQKISKLTLIALSIFFLYMILPIGPYTLRMWMKVVMMLFVLILISSLNKKAEALRIEKNIRVFAVALVISALFSVPFCFNQYVQALNGASFPRFQGLFNRATVLSMFCEVAIGLIAYNLVKIRHWKDWVLFGLITVVGALTLSKTFFIILLVVLVMMFVFLVRANPKKTLIISGCVVGAVLILGAIFPKYFILIFNRFFGKFSECKSVTDVINMITTYRYDLWLDYLQFLGANPVRLIFGSGLGAGRVGYGSSHNAYISIVYQLGLVGLALFVFAIVAIFKERKNQIKQEESQEKPKKDLRTIIPLTVIALILMVEDMILFILP